jgi:intracellular multiplication protein IcmL
MAAENQEFAFYRDYSQGFLIILISAIIIMLLLSGLVLYQITHRPLPPFTAFSPDGKQMILVAHDEPNFLPSTLTRWASKAATAAYSYDFAHYEEQAAAARPFFTEAGWNSYLSSIQGLIQTITANQLFVNGVVNDTPVIANQGNPTGSGYSWTIQLPFLVTTQSAESTIQKNFTVILTVVKIPTQINPVGIGIDRFVMVSR